MGSKRCATVVRTVPFYDADAAGLAWHGNYLRYFEDARCAVLEQIGYNYREMDESGIIWPLTDARVRFKAPVRYHDRIEVEARLTEWKYRMIFHYELRNPEGKVAATGRTEQVPVDRNSGKLLLGTPDFFEECMRRALERNDD